MHSREPAASFPRDTGLRDLPQQRRVEEDRASLLSANSGPLQQILSIKYVIPNLKKKTKNKIRKTLQFENMFHFETHCGFIKMLK